MATILVVDDRAADRQLLVTLLGYGGHTMLQASSGMEGLELIKSHSPDLVITDVLMGEMDGYELARRVRANPEASETRIMFYTAGFVDDEARALAQACGVDVLLGKPSDPQEIVSAVESLLTNRPSAPRKSADRGFQRKHTSLLSKKLTHKQTEAEILEDQRRLAEIRLIESEERYRSLVESSYDLVMSITPSGRIAFANRAWLETLGYLESDLPKLNLSKVIHPAHRERLELAVERVKPGDAASKIETAFRTKRGKTVLVEGNATGGFSAGQLVEIHILFRNVTEQRTAEGEVRISHEKLQALSMRLLQTSEAERAAISRELHDEVGQSLTALKMHLEFLMRDCTEHGDAYQRLGESLDITRSTLARVRDLSLNLRPPILDDLGLVSALRWHIDRFATRNDITAHFTSDETDLSEMPIELQTVCFRVVQEALTNVSRHARAQTVHIAVNSHAGQLRLTITDDGRGFDPQSMHARTIAGMSMGVLAMEERVKLAGGELRIRSELNKGVTVQADIPLQTAGRPASANSKVTDSV